METVIDMKHIEELSGYRVVRTLFSAGEISTRVRELSEEISRDFSSGEPLYMVGVLKGAFVFMADLGRRLCEAGGPPLKYDFISARTYGMEIKEEGEVSRRVRLDSVPGCLEGKDVLLVEDILDQGFTLSAIRKTLLDEIGAKTVKLCVLLDKELDSPTPEVEQIRRSIVPDYTGFRVPDVWLAGYGLDAGEYFRELSGVVEVVGERAK